MAFYSETNLPGIGKKVGIRTHAGDKLTLIIHHDGKRELYVFDGNKKPVAGLTFLDEEARRIGDLLSGSTFKPKCIETLEKHMENIEVEWFQIPENSDFINKKACEINIRKAYNLSIIGIIRNELMICNPDNDVCFNTGDTIVALGIRHDLRKFSEFLKKSASRED